MAAALLIGCGSVDEEGAKGRQAVTGSVSLDGSPLAEGSIQFVPKDPNLGAPVGATIADGKYAIEKEQGPLPGSYAVKIDSIEGGSAPKSAAEALENAERPTKIVAKNRVAAKFNAKTKLSAEVKAEGPRSLDFEVTSK